MLSNLCISLAGLLIRDVLLLLPVVVSALVFAMLLGVNPWKVIQKLRHFLVMILFATVMQCVFSYHGAIWPAVKGGAVILLRMATLIMSGAAIASCGARRGIQGLIQLKLPYEIAFMVYIALHFIPLLGEEIKDSLTAIQLRGVDIRRLPLRRRVRVYSYLFLPVIGASLVRAQDIACGLELRGFRAYPTRTALRRLHLCARDIMVMLFFAAGSACLILNYYGVFVI